MPVIGWREWVSLPDLGVVEVKAKIDTGARSSALHAFDIEPFERDGQKMVRFKVHPYQRDSHHVITTEAILLDERHVRNSGGHAELRPVICTLLNVDGELWPIELTLTHRDVMGFRMLLGRQAIRERFLVDAGRSYVQSPGPVHGLKKKKRQSSSQSSEH